MLLNSWLKSFRNLCETQSRVGHFRRKTRRNLSSNAGNRSAEVLENRQLLTTFTVNSTDDTPDANPGDGIAADVDGNVSLRAAMQEANAFPGADTIDFNDGSGPGVNFYDATPDVLTLNGSQLVANSELTITGPGADLLTVSGGGQSRVFRVTAGLSDVSIESLSIADGQAQNGGAISNLSPLTLRNVVLSDNSADFRGGAIRAESLLTVFDSTFSNNQAEIGGAIFTEQTSIGINRTTLSGNTATELGGAIFGSGGNFNNPIRISNSTLSGNSSTNAGGGAIANNDSNRIEIVNSTLTGNSALGRGQAIRNRGNMFIDNSIVAGNGAVISTDDIFRLGISPVTRRSSIVGGDVSTIIDTNLADNGGPTLTHALLPGSSAANAGNDGLAVDSSGNTLTTDQRGENRFFGTVDIGAFEAGELPGLVVTTSQDVVDSQDGLTSLREALAFANSDPDASTITFGDGSSLPGGTNFEDATPDVITLAGTELDVSTDVTFAAPGADLLTVSGANASRVFDVNGGDVTFSGLTISNGRTTKDTHIPANRPGAGIRVASGATVSANGISVRNNHAAGPNSEGTNNLIAGGIWNAGNLTLRDSVVTGNTARSAGGGIWNSGSLTVENSTIHQNQARGNNSGGGIRNTGIVNILNSTVTGNIADFGGGIWNDGSLDLTNTIVAGNRSPNQDDIRGIAAGTNNLIGDAANAGGLVDGVDGNIVGVDWKTVLENAGSTPTLANNGGPTGTVALLRGSVAIDAGDDVAAAALPTDQRGENRFFGTVDIGAYEVQNEVPTADPAGPYSVDEGSDVTLDGSASSDLNDSIANYEWDFNYNGTTFDVDATGATPDFTGIDDGTVSVALRVRDSFGAESEIVTTTVEVSNVDPAISGLTTDSATLESKSDDSVVTLNGSVTDAGSVDTHEVVVDWGDGTVETIVAASDLNASPEFSGTQHTYAAGGIYAVTVTVTDDDGGTVSQTTSTVVQGVGLVDGVLYIIGTNGDDSVSLKERHHGTQLKVRAKFDGGPTQNTYFNIADIDRIEMQLCDGDDYASLTHSHWWHQHSVDIPATIYGGDGNDVLKGGSQADVIDGGDGNDCLHGNSGDDTIHGGNGHDWIDGDGGNDIVYAGAGNDSVWGGSGEDILLGQSGNDWLFGGWQRDIIIAGEGADRLFGQSYDDVLITGDTNWDSDESALKTMRDLWTDSDSAWNRAQAIQDEGLEVFHDDDVDKAWGGWGLDWMLFDSEKDRVFC